ncbi:DUF1611 domain-containing protein [bacterium]|nr:DUF1611 domain-containing protein [bacterium]
MSPLRRSRLDGTAIILTHGQLSTLYGKTAHGLLRGTDRYKILGVVDGHHAGRDAGEVMDGRPRGVPVFATLGEALTVLDDPPDYCVLGCATCGGRLPPDLRALILEAIEAGMSMVNGLHQTLESDPEIAAAARRKGVRLIDVRKPPAYNDLHFWTGEILKVRTPRIAVLGTDCGLGKRTTARMLVAAANRAGIRSEMIWTGQTGWMQGSRFGFMLDAIPNDFVSGEMEHALLSCIREVDPDLIVMEGQSTLRNPSGPCGSEYILSGGARGVILQHAPGRKYFEALEELHFPIYPIESEVELLRAFGARTLAVTLNGQNLSPEELIDAQKRLADQLRLPVVRPLEEGVDSLLPVVRAYMAEERAR